MPDCFLSVAEGSADRLRLPHSSNDTNRLAILDSDGPHFLKTFVQEYNKYCGPFEWTKGPEKLRRIIELTEQWQSQ